MIYSAPRQGLFLLIISVSFCLNTALVMVSTENQVEKNRIQKGERLVTQLIDESALALAYEDRVSLSVIARRYTQEYDVNRIVIRDVNEEPLVQVGEAPLKEGVVIDELATRNHKVIGRVEMVLMPTTMSEIAKMIWMIIVGSFFFHLMLWLAYEKVARPTKEQLRSLSREIQTYYFPDHHYLDPIEEQLRIAKQEEDLELELVRLRELEHQLEKEQAKIDQRQQALAQSQLHVKQLEENQERLLSNNSAHESGLKSSNDGSNQQSDNENNEQLGNNATADNQTVQTQPDYLSEKIDPTVTPKTSPKTTSKTTINTEQASVQDIVFQDDQATNNKANNDESKIDNSKINNANNNAKITNVTKPITSSIVKASDGAKHKISELFAKIPVASHKQADSKTVNDEAVFNDKPKNSEKSDKLQQIKKTFVSKLGKYDKYLGKKDKHQQTDNKETETKKETEKTIKDSESTTTNTKPKVATDIKTATIETKVANVTDVPNLESVVEVVENDTKNAEIDAVTNEVDLDSSLDSLLDNTDQTLTDKRIGKEIDINNADSSNAIDGIEIAIEPNDNDTNITKNGLDDDEFAHGKFKYAMAVDSTNATTSTKTNDIDTDTENETETKSESETNIKNDVNHYDKTDKPRVQPKTEKINNEHHSGRRSINQVFKKHSMSEELSAFLNAKKQVSPTIDSPIHVKSEHLKDKNAKTDDVKINNVVNNVVDKVVDTDSISAKTDEKKSSFNTQAESSNVLPTAQTTVTTTEDTAKISKKLSERLSAIESGTKPKAKTETETETKINTATKDTATISPTSSSPTSSPTSKTAPVAPIGLEEPDESDIPKGFFSRRNPISSAINQSSQSNKAQSALSAELLQVEISFIDKYSLLSKLSPDMASSYLNLCSELLQQASEQLLKLPMLDGISLVNQPVFNQQGAVVELKSIPTLSSEPNQLALAGLMLGALYKMLNEIIYEKHREHGQFALTVTIGISQIGQENTMHKLLKSRAGEHEVLILLAKEELKYIERYIRVKRINTPNNLSEGECVYVKAINNELLKKIIKVRNSVLEED